MSHRRTLAPAFLVAFVLISAGCGGSGSYSRGVFHGETTYRVEPPSSRFHTIDVEDGNDLAWVDDADGTIIQVNGSCARALDIPLVALTNHLLIGFTAREYVGEPELRPMVGREALFTHVRARLDGVPRELLFVVTKKDECVYDFALVAAPGAPFERGRVEFDQIISSFSTEVTR